LQETFVNGSTLLSKCSHFQHKTKTKKKNSAKNSLETKRKRRRWGRRRRRKPDTSLHKYFKIVLKKVRHLRFISASALFSSSSFLFYFFLVRLAPFAVLALGRSPLRMYIDGCCCGDLFHLAALNPIITQVISSTTSSSSFQRFVASVMSAEAAAL